MHALIRAAARLALFMPLALLPLASHAQIKIGVTVSSTGPQASLGIPEKNTVALLPQKIAGESVQYIVLDDASDTNHAVTNTRKLIDEDKVDLIIGSSTTPNTLAMIDTAAEAHTPLISLGSSARLIEPMDAKRKWIFKTPHSDSHMASLIASYAADHGVKRLGFIGFNNALGEAFWVEVKRFATLKGITLVGDERYAPNDTSVTAQVLKLMMNKPDAVVIGASGTPAALPARALRERGYKGAIYFNHGVSNSDFLRVCGRDCNGALVPTGAVMVASQLPASNPVKATASDFAKRYDAVHGAGSVSIFAAYTWDIGRLLEQAVPVALKKGKPGTEAFRAGLRDALENVHNLTTATGIVNMSPTDHVGLDQRSRVMAEIEQGKWMLAPQ